MDVVLHEMWDINVIRNMELLFGAIVIHFLSATKISTLYWKIILYQLYHNWIDLGAYI